MDVELLTRLRNGDGEAFLMLVERYQQPMLRLARSMVGSGAVAEEAVQDTWMGVVRGIEQFQGRSSLKTWLFRILVNRTRSAGARERSSVSIDEAHAVDPVSSMPKDSGQILSHRGPMSLRTVSMRPSGRRSLRRQSSYCRSV